MTASVSPEVIEKWEREWSEHELRIQYRNDPDIGIIELMLDGRLITTWSYETHPHDALEEFRKVVKLGFMIARQSVVIELPVLDEYWGGAIQGYDGENYERAIKHAIESQGYWVEVKGD